MPAEPAPTGAPGAGAGTARGSHWSTQAACRDLDPDLFFDGNDAPEAVHICLAHCPVRRQCLAHAEQLDPRPFDCVMGGVRWGTHKRAIRQPAPAGRCILCRWRPS
jgi:hypothetical protein